MPNKLTTEEFVTKAKLIHGDIYDYDLVDYRNSRLKVKITCDKHGVFEQEPRGHISGQGCPTCSGNVKLTTEEFIKRAKALNGDKYDYSLVDYENAHTKVKIICDKHGVFEVKPNNHMNGNGCVSCQESKGEVKVEEYLKNNNFVYNKEHRFDECRGRKQLLPFDFYLPEDNVCIEYDGEFHYAPIIKTKSRYKRFDVSKINDTIKNEFCINNNIRLIRIPYWEFDNIEKILSEEI